MKPSLNIFAVTAMSTVQLIQSAPVSGTVLTAPVIGDAHVDIQESVEGQQLATRGPGFENMLVLGDDVFSNAAKSSVGGSEMLEAPLESEKLSVLGSTSGLKADESKLTPLLKNPSKGIVTWGDKDVNEIKPFIPWRHYGPPVVVVQKPSIPLGLKLAQDHREFLSRAAENEQLERSFTRMLSVETDADKRKSLEASLAGATKAKKKYLAGAANLQRQWKGEHSPQTGS